MDNPLFADAPRVIFRVHSNAEKMARSLKKLLKWVKDLLATRAGVFVTQLEGQEYRRQLTAQGGFFTVVVRPPGDWDAIPPIVLAFSLADLYLVGYQSNADGKWKLYSDSIIVGSGADNPANANYWEYLNFKGGYTQQMRSVSIGVMPLYFALHTLNNSQSEGTAIQLALGVFIVVISEALRFPFWKVNLVDLLRQFGTVILSQTHHSDVYFIDYFTDWSSICKRVRRGPTAFVRGDGFDTYQALIESVLVLLCQPPDDEL